MNSSLFVLIGIGLVAGVLSGVFGIGGGVVIVPALIYLAGFRQHMATGTSLAFCYRLSVSRRSWSTTATAT
jgi:uncharacterized membrane protein YfcA